MFSWLKKKKGFRWSVYVLRDRKELGAAMHSHNVGDLLGYIGGWFDEEGEPRGRYSLALNFNLAHTVIHLTEADFLSGGTPTKGLWGRVLEVDPDALGQPHLEFDQFEWLNAASRRPIDSATLKEIVFGKPESEPGDDGSC